MYKKGSDILDSEKNKVEYNNTLNSISNEYHDYNEYNKLNIQDGNYKEITSFNEFNDNKSSLKARKISGLFTKLLSSALVITMAVVMGTNFIFGPKSKINDVFIENYENMLFISIVFSEYYEEDNLELVIKNEFTDRVYKIEAFEEGPEEEKQYMYFMDVEGLKENVSYNISVVSGFNTLYKNDYVIEAKDDTPHTIVNRIEANYIDELIYVSVEFSKFNSDDYVLIQLEKEGVIIEAIPIDQVMQNEDSYIYDNSFSVNSDGEYNVCLYINNNLELIRKVDVQLSTYTTVSYFGYEYGDLTFYYYIDFDNYVDNEIISLNLYLDGNLVNSIELDNIIQEEEYYRCSGEIYELSDGKYDVVICANNHPIYQEEINVGYIWNTILYDIEINNENTNAYIDIRFSEFDENEEVKLIIYKDDIVILEEVITNVVYEDYYNYSYEFEIDEYGWYRCVLLIDNNEIYEDSNNLVYNAASSSVSNVKFFTIIEKILVIMNIDEYDENEDISLYITSDKGYEKSFDLVPHELPTGAGYFATVLDDGGTHGSNYNYTVYANGTAIVTSSLVPYQIAAEVNVVADYMYDGEDFPEPFVRVDVEENEYNWRYLIYNKNGSEYPTIVDANEYFEGTLLFVSLDNLEAGDYCFILIEDDGTNIETRLWHNFTLE